MRPSLWHPDAGSSCGCGRQLATRMPLNLPPVLLYWGARVPKSVKVLLIWMRIGRTHHSAMMANDAGEVLY